MAAPGPMDYHTLFVSNLVSRILFAIVLIGLSISNRKLVGLRWFSAALLLWIIRTSIEQLRGHPPLSVTAPLCTYGANAISSLVYLAIFLGYRRFLVSQGPRGKLVPTLILLSMTLYPSQIFFGPWSGLPLGVLPSIIAAIASIHLLLTRPRRQFVAVARVTACVFVLFLGFTGYRAVVIAHNNARLGSRVGTLPDPHVLVTMLVLIILDACFVTSFIWFYIVEIQGTLRLQTHTDNLTGALNGRALDLEAQREIARCRRHNMTASLIVLDIDYFKHLNDARGHDAGDTALRGLVSVIFAELRLEDLLARIGGEEFLVFLPQTPLASARAVAERIRLRIETTSFPYADGLPICITASFGVAQLYAEPDDTWASLRRRGDLAMYAAKHLGRNCVVEQTEPASILLREPTNVMPRSLADTWKEQPRQQS